MKPKLVVTVLLLNAAALVFFAVKWFFTPVAMATELGIQLTSADAITDAQAVYAGLELGVGVFLIVCAARPGMRHAGILAAALALSGLALCRGLGILLAAHAVTGATWKLLSTDILGAVINTFTLWYGTRKPPTTT